MTILVGIDVQPIGEVQVSMSVFGDRYTHRIFTKRELERCVNEPSRAASELASNFAAKEAVLKILDTRALVPCWKSIEVSRERGRLPIVLLHGEAGELARSQGVSGLALSLSQSGDVATALVVANLQGRAR